jgi:hypothetical protein
MNAAPQVPGLLPVHDPAGILFHPSLGQACPAGALFVILTPFGWILRLSGRDFLQLKSPRDKQTFWQTARRDGSLDRMF